MVGRMDRMTVDYLARMSAVDLESITVVGMAVS
jgi:hypothetical protein